MEEIEGWIYLNAIPYLKPLEGKTLIDKFGSPEAIFKEAHKELKAIGGIGEELIERIKNKEKWIDMGKEMSLIKNLGGRLISLKDKGYPPLLKNIHDPPLLLYVKGEFHPQDYKMSLAIVGTRRASYYGNMITIELAGQLAEAGFTIVSGMARGIDTASHEGALKKDGRTLAVLGSGLNVIYPPENKKLSERIIQNGALISEFPLNTPPHRFNFPRRNRVISGLSLGVVMVEGGIKSGALITASFALEQGREVFAVPGKIDSKHSEGTHKLIQNGAKLVTKGEDIISEIMPQIEWKEKDKISPPKLEKTEDKIYSFLSSEPIHIEQLIEGLKIPPSQALSLLLSLELKGLIRQLPGKFFVKASRRC